MNADTLLTALLADMDDAVTTRETHTALVTGHGTDEEIENARRAMNRARPGDRLSIEFAPRSSSSPNERRDVEVTLTDERYVYVTSGKTRPGHPTGGNLSADEQGEVWYQPTLMQAPRRVVALSLCKVLPLTRAA